MSGPPIPPPPDALPQFETCYRHPGVTTGVHCTRCNRPICPDCMTPAPVGYQCPECVDAARREFRTGAAARSIRTATGSMTKLLLGAMAAMYVVEIVYAKGDVIAGPNNLQLYNLGALYAPAIAAGQYWRFFSAMFLHAGILHIGMNAWALWIFGPPVEQMVGRARFLTIFFVSGFVGGAFSYAFMSNPAALSTVGVGASGAIVGVFGAFMAYNWRRRHSALAQAYLRQGIIIIALNVMITLGVSAIDWRAHLGGLIAGFLTGFLTEEADVRGKGKAAQVAAFMIVALGGVALVAWRTAQLKALGV